MGIKFHCPNGHKLNVKTFLAGKRGICPHCGVSVRIPGGAEGATDDGAEDPLMATESPGGVATATVGAATRTAADTTAVPATYSYASPAYAAPTTVAPVSPVTPVTPVTPVAAAPVAVTPVAVAAPVTAVTPVAAPAGIPVGAPAMPVAAPAAPYAPSPYATTPAAPVDPILEAPNAVWYVRPPSGGQFGPARGDIMRKWLGEGRVSSDSLVWRDGWADWKPALSVFPGLANIAAPTTATAAPATAAATGPAPLVNIGDTANKPSAARPRTKKKNDALAIGMVIGLGLLAVVLLVVFIVVISGVLQK